MRDDQFIDILGKTMDYCDLVCDDDFTIGEFLDEMEITGEAERLRCNKLIMEATEGFSE